ncbi:MAG: Insertion element protein [Nitrospiraceae bacterium]|nr:MAG: Insertion element protein [Nitrospiraceae bacterium]
MKTDTVMTDKAEIQCPACSADAVYKNGRIKTGKQRYLCLMCSRQFTMGTRKPMVQGKPVCPECGKPMNVYKLEGNVIRFRCSGYPVCKTFKKYFLKEEA